MFVDDISVEEGNQCYSFFVRCWSILHNGRDVVTRQNCSTDDAKTTTDRYIFVVFLILVIFNLSILHILINLTLVSLDWLYYLCTFTHC